MNDTTNKFCDQCCESVKSNAKICPHCSFERFPDPSKTRRKESKRLVKWFIARATLPSAIFLVVSGIVYFAVSEKDIWDKCLALIRHCFLALVCLHFYAFHIVYDEDEKKGGDDGGGGGGGGGGE